MIPWDLDPIDWDLSIRALLDIAPDAQQRLGQVGRELWPDVALATYLTRRPEEQARIRQLYWVLVRRN